MESALGGVTRTVPADTHDHACANFKLNCHAWANVDLSLDPRGIPAIDINRGVLRRVAFTRCWQCATGACERATADNDLDSVNRFGKLLALPGGTGSVRLALRPQPIVGTGLSSWHMLLGSHQKHRAWPGTAREGARCQVRCSSR